MEDDDAPDSGLSTAPTTEDSDPYRSTPTDLWTLNPVLDETDSRGPWPLLKPHSRLSSTPSKSKDVPRSGNEWLSALRRPHVASTSRDTSGASYRVTPVIHTTDIYRVHLYTWRVDKPRAYEDMHERASRNCACQSVDMYAAELGSDEVVPVTRQHFSEDSVRGNFFLICCPSPFVLRIDIVSLTVPDVLVSINPMLAVSDLKAAIYQARGYPPSRVDLIHRGYVLENSERLFLFNLRNNDTIRMVLQKNIFVPVHFNTFWDRMYDVDVDITCTVNEVISMILRLCVSGKTGPHSISENFLSPDALRIRSADGQILSPLDCVCRGLDTTRADNYLTIVEARFSDARVTLSIESEMGDDRYDVRATDGAKLVAVYLRLHGITNVPIDLMTLVAPGRTLNPFDNLHTQYHGRKLALMTQDVKSAQLLHTQRFDVTMPSGSIVPVHVNKGGQVLDIKSALERLGYTHAKDFSLVYEHGVLNDNRSLYRCGFKKDHNYVSLVRGEFLVNVVAVQGEMRPIRIQDHSAVHVLYQEGDKLYEPIGRDSRYLFCGNALSKRMTALKARLQPGNLIFQDRSSHDLILEILYGSGNNVQTSKLSINRLSVIFDLRRLLAPWRLPADTLDALEQAILWRNFPRSDKEVLKSLAPTETREDMLGAPLTSDIEYRWGFGTRGLGFDSEVGDEMKNRATRVRKLLGIEDAITSYIDLPPMQMHSRPVTLHYDQAAGLPSLIGPTRKISYIDENRDANR